MKALMELGNVGAIRDSKFGLDVIVGNASFNASKSA